MAYPCHVLYLKNNIIGNSRPQKILTCLIMQWNFKISSLSLDSLYEYIIYRYIYCTSLIMSAIAQASGDLEYRQSCHLGPQRREFQSKGPLTPPTVGGLCMIKPMQTQTAAMASKDSTAGLFDKNLFGWGR